jgi:hypothetical protein
MERTTTACRQQRCTALARPPAARVTPAGTAPQSGRSGSQRGNAVLEFALVAPFLLMLLFGVFEVGRALYIQQALVFSAREGARLAAVEGADLSEVQARVRDVLGPVTATSITVTGPNADRLIRVAVESELRILSGSGLLGPFSGNIPLRGESAMRFEN